MASTTIPRMDVALKQRQRFCAATHGRSVEEEARDILLRALASDDQDARPLIESILARIEQLGGVEFELPICESNWPAEGMNM